MIGEMISIAAAILTIYSALFGGKRLTMRLNSKPKFDSWNGFKVF